MNLVILVASVLFSLGAAAHVPAPSPTPVPAPSTGATQFDVLGGGGPTK